MKHLKGISFGAVIVLVIIIGAIGVCLSSGLSHGTWEKEFYHCAKDLQNRIDKVDASEYILPEYDERVRQNRIEVYTASLQAYISFVENWVELEGTTPEAREEIYRRAAGLMILIDDNHDEAYQFHDINREYCEFSYDHKETREELLFAGNQALQAENIIDTGAEMIREEFEHLDHYGVRYTLEAEAWEEEFHNCMERYTKKLTKETEIQIVRLWGEFVEQWAENNEDYAHIDAGSGLSIDVAEARRECYRTATLLMIYQIEQSGDEYQYVYNMKENEEFMQKVCE